MVSTDLPGEQPPPDPSANPPGRTDVRRTPGPATAPDAAPRRTRRSLPTTLPDSYGAAPDAGASVTWRTPAGHLPLLVTLTVTDSAGLVSEAVQGLAT